ncbi:unnamed protein product [Lupinus luteus]|uniref:Uncharacterized protein n=1 Tax=Lupinus luteus TaxID=3873 RepID=A0AAV1W744_LUPLU
MSFVDDDLQEEEAKYELDDTLSCIFVRFTRRARSSSPFSHRKPSTPYSSTSSSSSFVSGRNLMPRSTSSTTSFLNSGG